MSRQEKASAPDAEQLPHRLLVSRTVIRVTRRSIRAASVRARRPSSCRAKAMR